MSDYSPLALSHVETPSTQGELVASVREAGASGAAIYPIGGGTSLDYGLPPKVAGRGVVLSNLKQVLEFPSRDLTITVEAGITMAALDEILRQEGLRLPIDVPQPEVATLGGVIATAWSGPRRYGHGSIRDFVIGIRAVDGRGEVFNGGGRVVKNVAGYDFCKLLTGSLGSIGLISQVTLKLKPLASAVAVSVFDLSSLADAERYLEAITELPIAPSGLELFAGVHDGQARIQLMVLLEGSETEVEWMLRELAALRVNSTSATEVQVTRGDACSLVWRRLVDFPSISAPLVLKASLLPSRVTQYMAKVRKLAPQAALQAHAGNGLVFVRFPTFPSEGLSRLLIGQLQPLAAQCGGHIVILSNPGGQEMTPQSAWGHIGSQLAAMRAVKQQFDPLNILNPGRFAL